MAGLVLAAGGGRRMGGRPKALLADAAGRSLLAATVATVRDGGCGPVVVVLGAAPEAASLLDAGVEVVVAEDWAEGMGASLRRGLTALLGLAGPPDDGHPPGPRAALVTLADLPDVTAAVVARVVAAWREDGAEEEALVRAVYGGRPGHPVLVGRAHWEPLRAGARGDVGAQPYLRARKVREVDCDDLATGRDLDRPEDLTAWRSR